MNKPQSQTIRQIAEELRVSKQAVQKRIKREPLATELSGLLTTKSGTIYISATGAKLIKSAFLSEYRQPASIDKPTTSIDELYTNRQPSVGSSEFTAFIAVLQEQLVVKDKQIEELHTQLSDTTSALLAAQQTAQAAQALHAGTLQAQLTDGGAPGSKQGFFSKIFGRKSE